MSQPVVGLPEVVKYDTTAITSAGRQNDGGAGVGLGGHPGTVEGVRDEESCHQEDHGGRNLNKIQIKARFY